MLGHSNINSILVYTHLLPFDTEAEAYHHAVAGKGTEAGEFLEQVFRYECTTPKGKMIFMKAKKN